MVKDIIEVDGYAHWASYLVNGDASGLEADDLAECIMWLQLNDLRQIDCLMCGETTFFGYPDATGFLKGNCVTYKFWAQA